MSLSVSVLITNYQTWPEATACARASLKHCGDRLDEVLIVDDCPDSTSPNELPEPVRVVSNDTNQGYVRSVNIGFSKLESDVIVLFDSDAEPLMDFVPAVRSAFLNDPNLGAMAFHLVDEEGQPTGTISSEPSVLNYILGQKVVSWLPRLVRLDQTPPLDKPCLHSCAMAVRRRAFEDVGGFDEAFDFLDADIDFSMRLRYRGWRLVKSNDMVAYHEGGGSPQSTAGRVVRYHRNRWRLLRKHDIIGNPLYVKILLAIRHLAEYGILSVMGSILVDTEDERRDKLEGRQLLLRRVWDEYRY